MKTAIEVETSLGIKHLLQSFAHLDQEFRNIPLTDAIVLCVAKIGMDQAGSSDSEMHKAMLQSLLTAAIVDKMHHKF